MKRQELVTALELVGRALSGNNMVPIFECFVFTGKKVYAFNDALGIIAPCPTEAKIEPFAVNGKTLLGLLSASRAEEVEFQLGDELTVKAGRSTFKLPYFREDEFLFEIPKEKYTVSFPFAQALITGMTVCLLTSSKDNTQPGLMGLCLKDGNLYSCEGDALTRFKSVAEQFNKHPPFTIPNSFCEAVVKIYNETESTAGTLYVNHNWAQASFGSDGYQVYGRVIENENPLDHEALIKKTIKGKPSFVPLPKGLDHALARARVVADAESAKTVLTAEQGRLKLLTTTRMGVVRDTLAFPEHNEVQAHVSAAMMQRSIAVCDEMAILENCSCYRSGERLLIVAGNMEG